VTHDVAEAVALADRVLLVQDGGVTLDESVALARPRSHGSPAFAEIEGRVLGAVLKPQVQAAVAAIAPIGFRSSAAAVGAAYAGG
ncbi:MAG: aliphatic sulfonate ABC transporter ATP-binding protein, partial [Betaproteobacteria bacterium]